MKIYYKLTVLVALAVICSGPISAQQSTENLSSGLPAVVATWSQYGFIATHSSVNTFAHTFTRANVSSLSFQWAGELGTPGASAPVVGQGIVYVAADGMIFAFQASDGTPLWSHLSCSGVDTVEAALGPQVLLVGDGGGDLAAYDPVTGNQIWCNEEGGSITSAPAVDGTTVYITNGSDAIALDQATGTERWRFTPSDFSCQQFVSTDALSRNCNILNLAIRCLDACNFFGGNEAIHHFIAFHLSVHLGFNPFHIIFRFIFTPTYNTGACTGTISFTGLLRFRLAL